MRPLYAILETHQTVDGFKSRYVSGVAFIDQNDVGEVLFAADYEGILKFASREKAEAFLTRNVAATVPGAFVMRVI